MSSVGRGRGRGRGVLGNTTPTQETRPGPTQTNANASVTNGYQGGAPPPSTGGTMRLPHSRTGGNSRSNNGTSNIKDILNKSMKRSEIKTLVMQEIEKNNNKETVEDLVNIVCDKSIKDPDFASLGAELFNQVWVSEEQRKLIQTPLLSSVQKKYSTRKELKRDHFYGFVVLLCELFKLLRVKGLPLRPLTTSVCEVLKELIADENPTEDDLFYFFQEMESIGETIETVSVESMEEIMNEVRKIVISNDTIQPSSRCQLVQLIEMRASKWKLTDDVKRLYEDLNQDLMAEGR